MFPFISEESECPWASSGGRCFISSLKNQSSPLINQTMFYFISEGSKCTQASFVRKMFCFIAEVSKFVSDRLQDIWVHPWTYFRYILCSSLNSTRYILCSSLNSTDMFYVHLWTADKFYVHLWTAQICFMFISEQHWYVLCSSLNIRYILCSSLNSTRCFSSSLNLRPV